MTGAATTVLTSALMRVVPLSQAGSIRAARGLDPAVGARAQGIVDRIRTTPEGARDAVLRELTLDLDGVQVESFRVSSEEVEAAYGVVSYQFLEALRDAVQSIRRFHEKQVGDPQPVETSRGVWAWRVWRPIERIGLYVPGGRARYPSSVVMLGVPASVAGCPEPVLITPPGPDGVIPAATLVAAAEVGITEIYRAGGAQAIAALAYGTETIAPVDKIFGPGNAYVTAGKLAVVMDVAIDVPAGPSELMIIADRTADPRWVAADMLGNAEHGPDSPVVLVSDSAELLVQALTEVGLQLKTLPRREIAASALRGHGIAVVAPDMEAALDFANRYAPEHLQLMVDAPESLLGRVQNAGSVFLGALSANAGGDYATGTNHVLPTEGFARSYQALSTEAFGRWVQVQRVEQEAVAPLAATVGILAREEGLEGHARAAEIRLQSRPVEGQVERSE